MSAQPAHSKAEDVRYQKLSAINSKCGSLLQLASVLIFIPLLFVCLIALFVLFFKEHTTERFVDLRKYALNFALCVTGVGCVVVTMIVAISL